MKLTINTASLVTTFTLLLSSSVAFSQDTGAGGKCEGDGNYAEAVLSEEGGAQEQYATNPHSTATGAYQFLHGTLQSLGYIDPSSSTPAYGKGDWPGVKWTGKDGIHSRSQFMASMDAQNNALAAFTQQNLDAVSGTYTPGQVINGVPMSDGGAALAAHFLGAGGFNTWAASGFTTAGLDPEIAAGHGWSLDQMQQELMGRVAKGGCYDPGMIESENGNDAETGPITPLMPWEPKTISPVILPGVILSTV